MADRGRFQIIGEEASRRTFGERLWAWPLLTLGIVLPVVVLVASLRLSPAPSRMGARPVLWAPDLSLWLILEPLLGIGLYLAVFVVKQRAPRAARGFAPAAYALLAAMTAWLAVAQMRVGTAYFEDGVLIRDAAPWSPDSWEPLTAADHVESGCRDEWQARGSNVIRFEVIAVFRDGRAADLVNVPGGWPATLAFAERYLWKLDRLGAPRRRIAPRRGDPIDPRCLRRYRAQVALADYPRLIALLRLSPAEAAALRRYGDDLLGEGARRPGGQSR